MNDRELQSLIRMAVESDGLDDLVASDPRSSACLRMSRLDSVARAGLPPTGSEKRHLAQCSICRARFRALAGAGRPVRHPWLPWAARASAIAAAACLVMIIYFSRGTGGPTERSIPVPVVTVAEPVNLSVCNKPTAGNEPNDEFVATCDDQCAMVAVFRECDDTCECHDWQVHEWSMDGETLAIAEADDLVEIALDAADPKARGQLLVLAAPGQSEKLPTTPHDAENLLACLRENVPEFCDDEEFSAYAAAMQECLPTGVTLVGRTFSRR